MSAKHPLGEPERSAGRLGGQVGRRLSWNQAGEQLVVDIVVHDGMAYGLMFANMPATQVAAVRDSWALLE